MSVSSPTSFSETQAAERSSGCLRRFIVPPLAVVMVIALLTVGLSRLDLDQVESPAGVTNQSQDIPEGPAIAALFTPEVQAWEEKILAWSAKYQLDPNLVATVMQIESCGDPNALSPSGAIGLFQVMPYHFQEGDDPYAPGINARRGLVYLRQAQEAGGSLRLTLAGYNGGISGAQEDPDNWPAETRRYVYWGLGIYKDARDGQSSSQRLDEWLASGGAALCRQARKQ